MGRIYVVAVIIGVLLLAGCAPSKMQQCINKCIEQIHFDTPMMRDQCSTTCETVEYAYGEQGLDRVIAGEEFPS